MKDSPKNYLLFIYIQTGTSEKQSITNSCENECICSYMNNQYRFVLSAAWHNRLRLCINSRLRGTGSNYCALLSLVQTREAQTQNCAFLLRGK